MSLLLKKHIPARTRITAMPLPRATPRTPSEELIRARAKHVRRRLRKLRVICPDLPDDVLAHTSLRTLSVAVRRAGRHLPAQTSLKTLAKSSSAPELTPNETDVLPTISPRASGHAPGIQRHDLREKIPINKLVAHDYREKITIVVSRASERT